MVEDIFECCLCGYFILKYYFMLVCIKIFIEFLLFSLKIIVYFLEVGICFEINVVYIMFC